MSSARVGTTDELSATMKSLIDRVLEADVTETVARRGREIAAAVGEATEQAADRAQAAWRDSAPQRHDATAAVQHATRDATKWGRRAWKRDVRPQLRDLWKRREVAVGAAGAAVPVGRELLDSVAVRLNLRKREARHWRAFFLGVVVGAIAGALVALLTAPKSGHAMRDELAEKARDAGDWVPLFQRSDEHDVNGEGTAAAPDVTRTDVRASSPHEADEAL